MKLSTVKKKKECSRCGETPKILIKGTIVQQGDGLKAEYKLSLICSPCLSRMIARENG